jgi:hypothetical protein
MSGTNFPAINQPQPAQGGVMSPLGASMLGPQAYGAGNTGIQQIAGPLMSLLMMQHAQGPGAQGGAGPGPASDASMQAGWGGPGGGASMLGAGAASGAPGPPGAVASLLPSWLGGPTSTGGY